MSRIPVIIDTDPGVDDIVALLFALASPEIEILAIIVSYGNTDIESSYLNVFKTFQAVSRHIEKHSQDAGRFPNLSSTVKPIILARGSDGPLQGELHSAQYFHGRDGLGGIQERHSELDVFPDASHPQIIVSEKSGVDVALNLIDASEHESITYIALGPLTNLAKMTRRNRELVKSKLGRVVCMGGALDVPGNTSPVAEFNFFADPYAVKELLCPHDPTSGFPLDKFFMLPLDITTPHELPFPAYKASVDSAFESAARPSSASDKSPLTHFTSSFLEQTRVIMLQFGKDAMELHDIVAMWFALSNPPRKNTLNFGWKVSKRVFDIERTGELTRGMLVVDRRQDESAYALGANRAEVQAKLEKTAKERGHHPHEDFPVQVQVESATEVNKSDAVGVLCVTDTPGPEALLNMLLERVWGVGR
ncbi:nucleoside hydrolase [Dendrothele bispora CBS 962.96]|uniref:Nucleoside hydrolase n=1 Tax=Dendrothele bispora (strain CBS 962.96) TaxID=1314807 RepID=A0A4S8MU70_DENBC|nr:nucleoside hydrolase [Dendrothele bispora CBS 962.96]